jgi:uncharacterized membrane protein
MWLIGLLIGMGLGGIVHGLVGAVLGAVVGALAGAAIAMMQRMGENRTKARIRTLENTVEALRTQVKQLKRVDVDAPQGGAQPSAILEQSVFGAHESGEGALSSDPAPAIPAPPSPPSAWERVWVLLTGGNASVRVGVVVLILGVAFLMKYAYEHIEVPIEARLLGVALGAAVLLVIGWRLRARRPGYSQALQGGAVALLYLTVFGAGYLFHLLPSRAAFVLLVAIVAFAVVLAILQNALWIAILGIAGGFLAPMLASAGNARPGMLFSYYLVLNLGILAIALRKSWHPLNVLGLLFTFGVASVWGGRFYLPDYFSTTEPFLILFFLLYVAIAVIHALRRAPKFNDYVDTIIVFGTPLLAFALQLQLVRNSEYGAAWSAIAVSAFYLVLTAALHRRHQETLRLLVGSFLALGVLFATIALSLAFDGRSTAGAWALAGAAIYWVGTRQSGKLTCKSGLLLQFAAGVVLLGDMHRGVIEQPVFNGFFLGCVSIALGGLFCHLIIEQEERTSGHSDPQVAMGVFLWGLAWWLLGGLHEISVHMPREDVLSASLLFLTGTCAAFSFFWGRGWRMARFPALALAPLMAIVLVFQIVERAHGHPLAGLGAVAWPLAFLFHFRILRRHDDADPRYLYFAHSIGVWLLAAVGTWDVAWRIDYLVPGRYTWPVVAWALVPIALLAFVAALHNTWPVVRHPNAYLWTGLKPLVGFLALWTLYANIAGDGDPAPLPYVPLLNPLDIVHILAYAILVYWWRAVRASGIDGPREFPSTWPVTAWCVAIFFWANAVLFRTLHQYAGVSYQFPAILQSNLVQMSLSIFWTFLALGTMLVATRRRIRQMWIVGSVLMAAVVLKLLVIEVPRASAGESIVSIICVGALMLVLGYVAPVPPKHAGEV